MRSFSFLGMSKLPDILFLIPRDLSWPPAELVLVAEVVRELSAELLGVGELELAAGEGE